MTDRPASTPDERDELAAEFALGLLEGEDLALARRLLSTEPGFVAAVARWSGRLAPMLEEIEHVSPPPRLWDQISQRISEPSGNSAEIYRLRRKVMLWRGFSGAATAIAASLAVFLVVQPRTVDRPSPTRAEALTTLAAMIGSEENPAEMMATWDPANRRLMIASARVAAVDPNRSRELWVIPADGIPRSLGTMPASPRMRTAVDRQLAQQLHEGATLAVSVEPRGGSPTGQPTGPVIASGKLERA